MTDRLPGLFPESTATKGSGPAGDPLEPEGQDHIPRPLARELDEAGLARAIRATAALRSSRLDGLARRTYLDLFRGHALSLEEIASRGPLSRSRREILDTALRIEPLLEVVSISRSEYDNSHRLLLGLRRAGARHRIEAVTIPRGKDMTLCVSSQSGCPLGCSFCATGRLGFRDNLTPGEILEQHALAERCTGRRVTNVVFMGMGEPLLNYDAVLDAAYRLMDPRCAQISFRRIVLSTAGIVPQIRRYARERHPFPLYFSISSAIPEKRSELMPVEATHPLPELVDAIREYVASRRWNRRATLEYVAIPGVNMGEDDVDAIGRVFGGLPVIINVIPFNATDGRYRPPSWVEVKTFTTSLRRLNIPVKIRFSSGKRHRGGCGQLAAGLVEMAPLEGHHLSPPGIYTDLHAPGSGEASTRPAPSQ